MTSSFFGGTLYHYTLNIGLFILCMGIGSILADRIKTEKISKLIILTELALFFIAVSMPFYVIFLEKILSAELFNLLLWLTNMTLGLLSGFELPLFSRIFKNEQHTEEILFFDYVGMFCGSLAFSFFIFPKLGIFSSLWAAALINALVLIYFLFKNNERRYLIAGSVILPLLCVFLLKYSDPILNFLQQHYAG